MDFLFAQMGRDLYLNKHVYKNKYGRTEEIYECEDCTGCPYRGECCKKKEGNRTAK